MTTLSSNTMASSLAAAPRSQAQFNRFVAPKPPQVRVRSLRNSAASPISVRQAARVIAGIHTEVVTEAFADRILVLVTQVGKVGCLVSSAIQVITLFPGHSTASIWPLMGRSVQLSSNGHERWDGRVVFLCLLLTPHASFDVFVHRSKSQPLLQPTMFHLGETAASTMTATGHRTPMQKHNRTRARSNPPFRASPPHYRARHFPHY